MKYAGRYILILIVFCETLLNQGSNKPLNSSFFTLHSSLAKHWVVVIDAGHGGKDPGCHGRKFREKDVALAVSLKFGKYLVANDTDVKVVYTRTKDVFVPLNERAEIANKNHADFFICIHCNASPDESAFGSATYVMGLYKSAGNLGVAKRENASVLYEKDYKQTYSGFDPNSDEGNILFAMYQNMYLKQSLDLSAKIQKEYTTMAQRTDNGVKQAGFLVLWKTAMPSLLTEIGFLTNPDEEIYLGSQKGQETIAKCIFLAFQQYKDEIDGTTYNAGSYNLSVKDSADTLTNKPADTNHVRDSSAPHQDTAKIIYKVQFASSDKPLSMDDKRLQGLPDIEMYLEKNIYKYTAGHFTQKNDAINLQNKLRNNGFKDAFVVAFKGGKRIKGMK